jgi:type IV pilus assembly protein PilW
MTQQGATRVGVREPRGVTIVEMVVAMAVGLLILGGVFRVYQVNSLTFRTQEGLSRIQENGRYALHLLAREIRMAGFVGCSSHFPSISSILDVDANDHPWDFGRALEGYEAQGSTWSPALPPGITSPVRGSDVLTVRRAGGRSAPVLSHAGGQYPVQVAPGNGFKEHDVVAVGDCSGHVTVFQITNPNPGLSGILHHDTGLGVPGNAVQDLGRGFPQGEVMSIATTTYFVRLNTARRPALYRKVGTSPVEELVEGVENMQLLYGEDETGNGFVDRYVPADQVIRWDRVQSVRIGLLLQTVNEIGGGEVDASTYPVLDVVVDPQDDRRLRRVMTATVSLRNRAR